MKLLLIDSRISEQQIFIDSRKYDVDYVMFDYETDTFSTLLSTIVTKGQQFTDIALVQHTDMNSGIKILEQEERCDSHDIAPYSSFDKLRTFLRGLKEQVGIERFDFLGCAMYDAEIMPLIFQALETELGIDLRASTNFTGNAPDGDWIMESDNVDIRDKYFTVAIADFKGTLGIAPSAPTSLVVTAASTSVFVSFAVPAISGDSPILYYTVNVSGQAISVSGVSSPIKITGLSGNTSYTFTATASNTTDTSVLSTPVTVTTSTYVVPFPASWVQFIDGSGLSIEQGRGIASDSAGNVYCTGYVSTGTVTISGTLYTKPNNSTDAGAYIVKYSTTGALQWVQWVDGTGADQGLGIASDTAGNVYCTGYVSTGIVTINGTSYTKPSNLANQGAYIVKYNTNGTFQWVQWVDGTGGDQGLGIASDSNGGVYCTGYAGTGTVTIGGTSYTKPNNAADAGAYIVKYNTNGTFQWVQWVDGTGGDQGLGIASDSEGNVYCTGYAGTGTVTIGGTSYTKPNTATDQGAYIVKYNTIGSLQWVQWIDGSSVSVDQGLGIASDTAGNVYCTGYVSTGTVTIGGTSYTKPTNSTDQGAYIVKYNTFGSVQWVQWIDGTSADQGRGIASDTAGNVYCTGTVGAGTVTISGTSYTKPVNAVDNGAYIVKYNTNGALQWVQWVDGTGSDIGYAIVSDSNGGVYCTGNVATTITNIGGLLYNKPNNGADAGAFIVKFSDATAPNQPSAPTITSFVASATEILIFFNESSYRGKSPILYYEATSSTGNITVSGVSSPFKITGLSGNTSHTFTMKAYNSFGYSEASLPSSVVTSTYITPFPVSWVQWVDGTGAEQGQGIASDSAGNVYCTGFSASASVTISGTSYTKPNNSTDQGAYIVKYSTTGALQWVQWVDGSGADQGLGIASDTAGNVYCTGYVTTGIVTINGTSYTKPSNLANQGAYIVKYNTNGTFQWVQWVDGTTADQGLGIASDSAGNVYCTGYAGIGTVTIGGTSYTKPNNGADHGAYIVKYNTFGNVQWVQWVDGTSSDQGLGIASDSEGNVYCTGYAGTGTVTIGGTSYTKPNNFADNGAYIVKYNTNGALQWVQWIDGTGVDQGRGIASDSAGNVYCTGYVSTGTVTISGISYAKPHNSTSAGAYIVKYSTTGALQWVQWVDGTGGDQGLGIASDTSGNVYCTGYVGSSTGTFTINGTSYTKPNTAIDQGAYIVKYNTNGIFQWVQWVDGTGIDQGLGIASDSNGGVYCTGYVSSYITNIGGLLYNKPNNGADAGAYIVKFSDATTPNQPSAPTITSFITSNTEIYIYFNESSYRGKSPILYYEATSSTGNITVSGVSSPFKIKGLSGNTSYTFTMKAYNSFGYSEASLPSSVVMSTYIAPFPSSWVQWIDGNGADQGLGIASDSAGNVYCTGYVTTGSVTISGTSYTKPNNDAEQGAYIVKYNTAGALQWVQWIDGNSASTDQGQGIASDSDGNVYCTGYVFAGSITISGIVYNKPTGANQGAYIVKYNTFGNVQWVQWVDGTGADQGQGIASDSEGNVYCTGSSASNSITISGISYSKPSAGNQGAYIVKYNTNGNFIWIQWIDGTSFDQGFGIASDTTGNVYCTGYVSTNAVTISGIVYTKPEGANQGAYIVKYNTTGALQWVQWVDGTNSEQGLGIASDNSGNAYCTGYIGTSPVTISGTLYSKPNNGTDQAAYIVKYNTTGALEWVQWVDGTNTDRGQSIASDTAGNIYCTGFSLSTSVTISGTSYAKPVNAADQGAYIVKYNTNGALQWVQWVDGIFNDNILGITSDSNGGVYCTGYVSANTVSIGGLLYDKPVNGTEGAFIVKFSDASTPSKPTEPSIPSKPTSVTATGGNQQVSVSFTAPESDGGSPITSYTVVSSGGQVATGSSSPITVTGLTNGTSYTFTVKAYNTAGFGPSSDATSAVIPNVIPNTPTISSVTFGSQSATITFSPPVNNGTQILYYSVTSTPGNITVSGSSSPITITGLTNEIPYTFTLTATNAAGTSTASAASASVTPSAKPGAPAIVSVDASDSKVIVSFNAPSYTGASSITSYTIVSSGGQIATGSSSPITVTGLTNGTSYTFTVKAYNTAGFGPSSVASASVTPVTVPGAPTISGVTVGTSQQAQIAFTAPVSNGGSAILRYIVTVSGSDPSITVSGVSSPITLTGLTNGQQYTFIVTALNAVGTSSEAVSSQVTVDRTPDAPTILTAIPGNAQAIVSFMAPALNGSSTITGYQVTSNPGGYTKVGVSSPITISGLMNGQTYNFTVRAYNGAGFSTASAATISVKPKTTSQPPTILSVSGSDTQAIVYFSEPLDNGGDTITQYTVTSSPEGITVSGLSSPININGLTNGISYRFTMTATNSVGTGTVSAQSLPITPFGIIPENGAQAVALANAKPEVDTSYIAGYVQTSTKTAAELLVEMRTARKALTASVERKDKITKAVAAEIATKAGTQVIEVPFADIVPTLDNLYTDIASKPISAILPDFSIPSVTPVVNISSISANNYIHIEAPSNSEFTLTDGTESKTFKINTTGVKYMGEYNENGEEIKRHYLGSTIMVGTIPKRIIGFGSILLGDAVVKVTIPITFTLSGVDAQILGQLFTMAGTKINVNEPLSLSGFYDPSGYSWIQYKQGANEDDFTATVKDISAAIAMKDNMLNVLHISGGSVYDAANQGTANLDCSAVFVDYASKWTNFHNLQDFVLSYFANKVLGHPGALAAISNDSQIRANVTSGFPTSLNEMQTMGEDKLKSIVQQIMNQDLARFSQDEKDVYCPLKFRAGDKVIMRMILADNTYSLKTPAGNPSSVVGGVTAAQSASATTTSVNIGSNDSYLLVFTLA